MDHLSSLLRASQAVSGGLAIRLPLYQRMQAASLSIAKPLYEDETLASFRCRDADDYVIEIYWDDAP